MRKERKERGREKEEKRWRRRKRKREEEGGSKGRKTNFWTKCIHLTRIYFMTDFVKLISVPPSGSYG